MRGFQPGKARAVPQNYADGGVVSTIKGMLGFGKKKPEPLPADLNKMPPPSAGQAASQPEPPKKAISEYSGMSALERRMKAAGLADGGLVRGPGTGISDDIEDDVEEGTFVMPADSTEAIGPDTMDQLGKADVPVNLSNGEAKLPPEALQAIGAQVMEAIKDVTHVPAANQARGFPMGEHAGPALDADDGRMNFADGGVVGKKRLYLADAGLATQERLKREGMTIADRARQPGFSMGAAARTTQPTAQSAPVAPQAAKPSAPLDPQAQADRATFGSAWDTVKGWTDDAGLAIADVASLVPRGLVGAYDSAVVRPMRAAGVNADYLSHKLVPYGVDPSSMTPFTDQKRIAAEAVASKANVDPSAARPTSTVPATPQATADAPKPNTPPQASDTAKTDVREVSPGIFLQGNSFGDSAAAATAGAQPSQGPSARDMQAMNNLIARDPVAGAMDRALGVERDPAQAATGFPQGGARQAPAAAPASAAASSAAPAAPAATTARGFQPAGQSAQPADVMGIYARASEAMKGAAQVQREIDGNQSQRGPGSTFINHSGNDWESENNLKNLRTSASSIFNKRGPRGAPSVEEMAYMKALDADLAARNGNNPAAMEAMRQQGGIQQAGMREQGENARSGRRDGLAAELGRGQLDLQRNAQGFTTRQLERQEKYQAEYDAAETPEARATIAQKIRDTAGKNTDPKDNFMVVGGGQEWDAAAGAMRNVPQRLVDLRTGQDVGATGQGAQAAPAPADPKERKVGQVYVAPNGANVRWTGQGWQQA